MSEWRVLESSLFVIAMPVASPVAGGGDSSLFFLWLAKPVMGAVLFRKSDGRGLPG